MVRGSILFGIFVERFIVDFFSRTVDWSCPVLGATRLPYIDTHRDAPTEQNEGGFFDFFDGGGPIEKSRMDTKNSLLSADSIKTHEAKNGSPQKTRKARTK